MPEPLTTFLFTDIEGSTRLWEEHPERMRDALARHDRIARACVEEHRGRVVKMTGDGLHAAFEDPLDAIRATVDLQLALSDPVATAGIALAIRCGLHAGPHESRDGDYFGSVVNRAARIMGAAHGGQTLLSESLARHLAGRLPEGVVLRDLGPARLRDLAAPERIHQLVHPRLRADFPALRSLEGIANNLPHALSSFVGREQQASRVLEMLGGSRLVTLVGMGGIGKTRLALQVAADAIDGFGDGCWLVELAPLGDPARLAQAVASVLGVVEEAGRSVEDALVRHLRSRDVLLVLDNCEHLAQACAALARQLLTAAPGLKILATSREPLRVVGESTYPVPPLAVPGPREAADPEMAIRFEGVRLFCERAAASNPSFEATARNLPAIAAICHRLDGIPLALELAAARARSLSPQQIAIRLDDRFRLLSAGDPTALPRQRTLRATIDWSYELLSEAERALLRQLAVFTGGWTLEAAEAVCAGCGAAGESVVDLIGGLVDRSLVNVDASGQRYHLLETVRQYAQERLVESGEIDAVRDRHLAYFAAWTEGARPGLVGPEQATWLVRLDQELDNVLAAHAWAGHAPESAESGLNLAGSLKFYWLNRGLLELGHRVLAEALARPGAQAATLARCRGLFHAGQLRYVMGDYGGARAYLEESLEIARGLQAERSVAAVLQPLGMAALAQRDMDGAQRCLEEAVAMAERRGDPRELATAYGTLARLHAVQGDADRARALHRQAIALFREVGDSESLAIALLNATMVSSREGEAFQARAAVLEAIEVAHRIQSSRLSQAVLEVCAGLAAMAGDAKHCARFYGAAEAQAGVTGVRRDPSDEAFLAPLLEKARAQAGEACFRSFEAGGRGLTQAAALEEASAWLAPSTVTCR